MHGVGGEMVLRVFAAAGLPVPHIVEQQFAPDARFPTVQFPNPEEPGAMDLVLALADERGAAIALANDPDADRLGAAIPQPDGSWRRIGGDELGWLLADHILGHPKPEDGTPGERLVITTLVSSSLLEAMAADHGVHFAETFTGFKWIGRTVLNHPEWSFVFGYEQALGYLVARRPLDKDGISAAVLLAEVAAAAAEDGTTLQTRLDEIATRYGRHVIADRSVQMDPARAAERVRDLLAEPPEELGGAKVVDVTPYPDADLLRLTLDGGIRVQVRPSGTEPKVKLYGEGIDVDPRPYIDALADLLS
jgi:phosphomannomutase